MTTFLAIRNWADFQHYRDRDPVWIKVYSRLLDDADFLALPEAAQAQLVKLWLVASRCKNRIKDDKRFLCHALHTNKLHVDALIATRFLERIADDTLAKVEHPASDVLAKVEQNDSPHVRPRAREEGETEKEAKKDPPPSARESFFTDPRVSAFFEHMEPRERTGWRARLGMWLEGHGLKHPIPTADEIADGLVAAMTAKPNGALGDNFVRGCIRSVQRGEPTPRDEAPTFTELLKRREGAA
jgi:hypothetical protein